MTEKQLIHESLCGNVVAQKQLYDAFAPAMLSVAYRYTKTMADAEDVLQETFIKVFQKLHTYRYEGELGGWIKTIAVRTALNFLKSHKKYKREFVFDKELLEFNDSSSFITEQPLSEQNISVKEILLLIQKLPIGYQTIFNLHAIEGFAHTEIAAMLGITDITVRTQYFKARKTLMSWINADNSLKQKLPSHA